MGERMALVSKKFHFDSAHHLPDYKGQCGRLHGHRWELEVTLKGIVNDQTGMVMDFKDLSEFVKEVVIDKLDHQNLNDVTIKNPTAENLAAWIFRKLYKYGLKGLYTITLWETPDAKVKYTLGSYAKENDEL